MGSSIANAVIWILIGFLAAFLVLKGIVGIINSTHAVIDENCVKHGAFEIDDVRYICIKVTDHD